MDRQAHPFGSHLAVCLHSHRGYARIGGAARACAVVLAAAAAGGCSYREAPPGRRRAVCHELHIARPTGVFECDQLAQSGPLKAWTLSGDLLIDPDGKVADIDRASVDNLPSSSQPAFVACMKRAFRGLQLSASGRRERVPVYVLDPRQNETAALLRLKLDGRISGNGEPEVCALGTGLVASQ